MGTGLFGCNPIPKSGAFTLMPVIPAKAGTQGFQSLAPGSPLSRGRRIWLSAGFPDSLLRRCDGISLTRLSGSVPPPSGPARRLPAGPGGPGLLILRVLRRLLDERRNLFGARLVDRVACALDLDHVAVGARGIEPLQVGIDDLVRVRHERPARLHPPGRISDRGGEHARRRQHLGVRLELGLLRRQVGREGFREGDRIEIRVAVRCFLDRVRLARGTRKALSVRCLGLTRVRCVRRDKDEPDDMRVGSGLRNDGATIAVCDQDARAWLQVDDPLGRGHIVLQRGQWLLNEADVIAVPYEDLVDRLPTGAINPGTVNEDDVLCRGGHGWYALGCKEGRQQSPGGDAGTDGLEQHCTSPVLSLMLPARWAARSAGLQDLAHPRLDPVGMRGSRT